MTKTFLLRNRFFFFTYTRFMPGDTDELAWWQKENFFFMVFYNLWKDSFTRELTPYVIYSCFSFFFFFFRQRNFLDEEESFKRILFIDHRYLSIVCHRSSYIQCIHVFNSHIILKFIRKFYLKHTSLSLSFSSSFFSK